jgi:hypothetical protein
MDSRWSFDAKYQEPHGLTLRWVCLSINHIDLAGRRGVWWSSSHSRLDRNGDRFIISQDISVIFRLPGSSQASTRRANRTSTSPGPRIAIYHWPFMVVSVLCKSTSESEKADHALVDLCRYVLTFYDKTAIAIHSLPAANSADAQRRSIYWEHLFTVSIHHFIIVRSLTGRKWSLLAEWLKTQRRMHWWAFLEVRSTYATILRVRRSFFTPFHHRELIRE